MKQILLAVVVVVVVLCSAVASFAAGPYDGVWSVVQSSATKGSSTFFMSIHEDDEALMSSGFNFVALILNLDDTWGYSVGVQASGYAQGSTFGINQAPVGMFIVTFTSATAFSGTSTSGNNTFNLTGIKMF